MLIAILTDIHANREAFEACLAQARTQGATQFVLLGDFVGYGADPDWVVATVMQLVERGAIAVRGNHDAAVGDEDLHMNLEARIAIEWTRSELGRDQRRFLSGLPLFVEDRDRLYVHAEASRPNEWIYVVSAVEANDSLAATSAFVTFCGHVHRPALYSLLPAGKPTASTPKTGVAIPLLSGRRWLAVLGSVGQPRDGNPAAAYLMLDTERREITYCRVAYDVGRAAAKIREQGLPGWLADRLLVGR